MKEIKLTRGQMTTVSNGRFRSLNQQCWYAGVGRNGYYAVRGASIEEKKRGSPQTIKMHRQIMGLVYDDPKKQVDHINGDTLDNRRCNLRIVPNRGNTANRRDQSKHGVGVEYNPKRKKQYRARAHINGVCVRALWRATPEESQQDYKNILKEHGLGLA